MNRIDNAAIETLRAFALVHGEIQFAHLCTAALAGEAWAGERIARALALIAAAGQVSDVELTHIRLTTIDATDTAHPDGASGRSVEV